MPEPWTVIMASHAIAASGALLLGGFQVIRPVRGDPVHKALGRIWVTLMLWTSLSSFFFGGWTQALDIFLRALAIWTFISVPLGIRAARRGDISSHRGFMVGNYLGLVGAFIGVVAVRSRMVPSWFVAYPVMMSLIALALCVVCGFVVAGVFATHRTRSVTP